MRNKNNHMPDVLDCLANLSNDEVFTPPDVANKMLDMLPPEVFASQTTTFLDPFTKSGVFLREITKRLLRNQIPNYESMASEIETIERTAIQDAVRNDELKLTDPEYGDKARAIGRNAIASHERASEFYQFEKTLQQELNRILTTQVFGIAITELTAHLTRRSLYCSKNAAGEYSICDGFGVDNEGNIRFKPMRHTWDKGGNCIWCGASKATLDRPDEYEQHAYEFIHKDIEELRKDYNDKMFENLVICGNPPYQLDDSSLSASATPIYNKFVEQAKRLNPKYLTMIIPSRWMAGGKGLDDFRNTMINDKHITQLHDYINSNDCFSGVDIKGGVCFFLREREKETKCHIVTHNANNTIETTRYLKEEGVDVFIRQPELIGIKNKVWVDTSQRSFAELVSVQKPYGLRTDFFAPTLQVEKGGQKQKVRTTTEEKYGLPTPSDTPIIDGYEILGLVDNKRMWRYVPNDYTFPKSNGIGKWKIFIPNAYGCGTIGEVPSTPVLGTPVQVCTETFLELGPWDNKILADNALCYLKTKFFRALVSIMKQTQHTSVETYRYVPLEDFTLASDIDWSLSIPEIDRQLYAKYGLSEEEIEFIGTNIQEMQ